jgi:exo-beta-1,3-glucanase (GH17 family)
VSSLRAASLGALVAVTVLAATAARSAASPVCPARPAAQPALARLREALGHARFVTYQPTALRAVNGRLTRADAASIRADLTTLRRRFDGLITYDAVHGAENIPAIATALEFRALIVGVWNPLDDTELDAAIDAAHRFPRLIAGISLGNELLFSRRSDPAALAALTARVRARLPGTPLTTTEPFHMFYAPASTELVGQLDFLTVNVHPVFQPWFPEASGSSAAQFVVNVLAELAPHACGPIVVKETGMPTAPASGGFGESRQASFYRELRRLLPPSAEHAFAYFAAFDAPWRAYDAIAVPGAPPGVHPEEAHWGLYDADRQPKQAARELAPLTSPPSTP